MDIAFQKRRVDELVVQPMHQMIHEYGLDTYDDDDILAVKSILDAYMEALAGLNQPDDAQIMAQVQKVVLTLNDLNESKDYELIETEEREWLWEVIQKAAEDCGLQDVPEDVTEEWRDW